MIKKKHIPTNSTSILRWTKTYVSCIRTKAIIIIILNENDLWMHFNTSELLLLFTFVILFSSSPAHCASDELITNDLAAKCFLIHKILWRISHAYEPSQNILENKSHLWIIAKYFGDMKVIMMVIKMATMMVIMMIITASLVDINLNLFAAKWCELRSSW